VLALYKNRLEKLAMFHWLDTTKNCFEAQETKKGNLAWHQWYKTDFIYH